MKGDLQPLLAPCSLLEFLVPPPPLQPLVLQVLSAGKNLVEPEGSIAFEVVIFRKDVPKMQGILEGAKGRCWWKKE